MSAILLPNQLANGRLQVRVAWGAVLSADPATWAWTDITTDVLQANGAGITISPMGRSNEASVAQPAGCSFRVKNQGGAYTPYNPASTNYPNVRLGTPVQVRVSLDGGSNYWIRFQGEVAAWSPGWDVQGKFAYVAVTASGRTRRLGQGNKPIRSALYRKITIDATQPLAYWSMEEPPRSVQFAGVPGNVAALDVANGARPPSAAMSGPPGSAPLLDIYDGTWTVRVPIAAGGDTFYSIEGVAKFASTGADGVSEPPVLHWFTTGTFAEWSVTLSSLGSQLFVNYIDGSGITTRAITYNPPAKMLDNTWHHYRTTTSQVGGNMSLTLYLDGVQVGTATVAGTQGHVASVQPISDQYPLGILHWSVGHVAVYGVTPPAHMPAFTGFTGEDAVTRLTRLCAEDGIPLTVAGSSTTAMGPQGIDTLMNLLRECETADLGYLLDGLGPGLNYIARTQLYNQIAWMTINANSGQVPASPGPQPTNDDQRLRNRVTVTRTNGSFVVVEDTNGPLGTAALGVFDNRIVVNLASDADLAGIGAWLVHFGTVEGMRYPLVLIDLTAAPELASTWVGAAPTNRIDLTNLSSRLTQHPPGTVSLVAEGWTEFLSSRRWAVQVNCSPYQPWNVDALDTTFRLELDGMSLNSSLAAGGTTLSLKTAAGKPLFTTSAAFPADFPTDLNVGGWQIHVTAASGAASPQTLTIDPAPNTATIPANTPGTLWRPACLAL